MIPLLGISIWSVAKVMVLFALILYIVFAFVIIKQTKIMTETLELGLEKTLRTISFAHMLFAVGTFILALIIL